MAKIYDLPERPIAIRPEVRVLLDEFFMEIRSQTNPLNPKETTEKLVNELIDVIVQEVVEKIKSS